MNCILLGIEYRGSEKFTFKSREGKEIEMEIYSFLDSKDNKIKLTLAAEDLRSENNFDLSILKRGRIYDVECLADQMALISTNDMATTYQQRFKIVSFAEHYEAVASTPFNDDEKDKSDKAAKQLDKTGGK